MIDEHQEKVMTSRLDMYNAIDAMERKSQKKKGINNPLEKHIQEAFEAGDAANMLAYIGNHISGHFVYDNMTLLNERGILSDCVKIAWTSHQANNSHNYPMWKKLLSFVNYQDHTPKTAQIYRGVAGNEPYRHELGFSWTGNKETAKWFSARYELDNPEIIVAKYEPEYLIFYTNERTEDEYVMHGDFLEIIDRIKQ